MAIFYLNGKFLSENEAKISVFDLGFLRAYAVFEFLRTYNQKPFYLKDHLLRLLKSAKILGLEHNFSLPRLQKIVLQTLKKNLKIKKTEYFIRIVLTGGKSPDGLFPSKPNLVVMVTPAKKLKKEFYQKGAKLITKVAERISPQAKTTVYSEEIKFLKEAKKKGAIEVLLISKKGEILEGVTSNFFAKVGKKLITPPKNKVLPGITRQIVINLCQKLKIPLRERNLYFKEIKNFKEAFISSTTKEILPIVKIDNIKISQKPGPFTKKLMLEFERLTKNY